jgi:hypothetical protein
MFQRKIIIIGILALGIFVSGQVLAHTPLCSCYDNANGTVKTASLPLTSLPVLTRLYLTPGKDMSWKSTGRGL